MGHTGVSPARHRMGRIQGRHKAAASPPSFERSARSAGQVTCLRSPHDVALSFFTHMRGTWARQCNGGDAAPFDNAFTLSDFALDGLPRG